MNNKEPKLSMRGFNCTVEELRPYDMIAHLDFESKEFLNVFFVKRIENQKIYGVFIDGRNKEEIEYTHKDWRLIGETKIEINE